MISSIGNYWKVTYSVVPSKSKRTSYNWVYVVYEEWLNAKWNILPTSCRSSEFRILKLDSTQYQAQYPSSTPESKLWQHLLWNEPRILHELVMCDDVTGSADIGYSYFSPLKNCSFRLPILNISIMPLSFNRPGCRYLRTQSSSLEKITPTFRSSSAPPLEASSGIRACNFLHAASLSCSLSSLVYFCAFSRSSSASLSRTVFTRFHQSRHNVLSQ